MIHPLIFMPFVFMQVKSSFVYVFFLSFFSKLITFIYIYLVVSLLLACYVGRIVWVYRNEIFAQIHATKWTILWNYAVLFLFMSTEMNLLKGIVYECDINPSLNLEKIYNLFNVFFCAEAAFLIGIVLMAPN